METETPATAEPIIVVSTEGDGDALISSLKVACAAIGKGDKDRPMLDGVRLFVDSDTLTVVATDSFCLWAEGFTVDCAPFDVIVEAKELKRTLTDAAREAKRLGRSSVEVSVDKTTLTVGGRILRCDPCSGAVYPAYRRILEPVADYPDVLTEPMVPIVGLGEPAIRLMTAIGKHIGWPVTLQPDPFSAHKALKVHTRPGVSAIVMPVKLQ